MNDEATVEKLVTENLAFATSRAKRWFGKYPNDVDDLVSSARMGLLLAAQRYDFRPEAKFITYAAWWIDKELASFGYTNDGLLRVPAKAFQGGERSPGSISLDHQLAEGFTVADTLAVEPVEIAAFERESDETKLVRRAFARMPKRERRILEMRHGIGNDEELNLREIGVVLGLSHERVRQLESSAKMRARFNAKDGSERARLLANARAKRWKARRIKRDSPAFRLRCNEYLRIWNRRERIRSNLRIGAHCRVCIRPKCGKPFEYPPGIRGPVAKFCSHRCAVAHGAITRYHRKKTERPDAIERQRFMHREWHRKRAQARRVAANPRRGTCQRCGGMFIYPGTGNARKYCSEKHRDQYNALDRLYRISGKVFVPAWRLQQASAQSQGVAERQGTSFGSWLSRVRLLIP